MAGFHLRHFRATGHRADFRGLPNAAALRGPFRYCGRERSRAGPVSPPGHILRLTTGVRGGEGVSKPDRPRRDWSRPTFSTPGSWRNRRMMVFVLNCQISRPPREIVPAQTYCRQPLRHGNRGQLVRAVQTVVLKQPSDVRPAPECWIQMRCILAQANGQNQRHHN